MELTEWLEELYEKNDKFHDVYDHNISGEDIIAVFCPTDLGVSGESLTSVCNQDCEECWRLVYEENN
jgi:hypothetical protein